MHRAFDARVPGLPSVIARGSHPLPDDASVEAGEAALALASDARRSGGEIVLLLSGGASAMLAAPAAGVTLELKRDITRRLLAAGAPIQALNAVRKHLSRLKGGRLAHGVRCTTFAISDVVDDDPASIGSGPAVADPTTVGDARRVLEQFGVAAALPVSLVAIERAGETPKPGDLALAGSRFVLIGSRRTAMDGVAAAALARGHATILFDEPVTGDAAAAGAAFADRAVAAARRIGGRAVVIASGETTVRVRGNGAGGRNQEFAIGAAQALARASARAAVASFGTDGIDGNSPAAGAIVDATTITRARAAGLPEIAEVLAANDSHPFLAALGDAIITGPTGTNVGDVFIALVG
jgi:glycerate-2-kinase